MLILDWSMGSDFTVCHTRYIGCSNRPSEQRYSQTCFSDHLSYVTLFECSPGRSHKTGLTVHDCSPFFFFTCQQGFISLYVISSILAVAIDLENNGILKTIVCCTDNYYVLFMFTSSDGTVKKNDAKKRKAQMITESMLTDPIEEPPSIPPPPPPPMGADSDSVSQSSSR